VEKKEAAAVVRGGKSLVRVNDLQALRGSLEGIIIWTDFTFPGFTLALLSFSDLDFVMVLGLLDLYGFFQDLGLGFLRIWFWF
jgi:hypothetical protein